MALILKKENNNYQKILIDKCYITKNGLYVATIVFKDKFEREKDKSREKAVSAFKQNVYDLFQELKQFEGQAEESLTDEVRLKLKEYIYLNYVYNNIRKVLYDFQGLTGEMLEIDSSQREILEKYDFDFSWYENPVILIREDVIWSGEYQNQDFTLESFYNSLKENIYTDSEGNLLIEDDL